MNKPFQRKEAESNTQVGRDFEAKAGQFFAGQGLRLQPAFEIQIGINDVKKQHKFDLGDPVNKVIVECKSHTWTEGDNVPSAKLTTWDQAMYFFFAAQNGFRKIFFILKDYSAGRKETLGAYYIRTHPHLIPTDVEIWEYDESQSTALRIR